jgi:hypothetical protein
MILNCEFNRKYLTYNLITLFLRNWLCKAVGASGAMKIFQRGISVEKIMVQVSVILYLGKEGQVQNNRKKCQHFYFVETIDLPMDQMGVF